ncbi:hypothetical protein EMCRGX_G016792 [Ephydatia muelleri]
MAFNARVSDPAIGGTYMTLLNTVANIAVAIPKTVVLWLVDVVSFKDCTGVTDFNLDCQQASGNDSCSYVSDRGGSTARAISVVAIFSSLLSCMGSVLIVYVYLRWPAVRSGSRAIITYLAIADFVTGFGYIMGSSNYLQYTSYGNVTAMPESTKVELCNNLFTPVCKIQSFLTTSSSMMSFLWTLILAIYLHMTVVKNRVRLVQQLVPLYHVIAWGLPTVVIFVMLATDVLGYAPVASANWCFIGVIRDTTLRIAMIMVGGKFLEIITYVVALVLFVSTSIRLRIQKDACYLDDGVLAGSKSSLLRALTIIENIGPSLGIFINLSKCEVFCGSDTTMFPDSMKAFHTPNLDILGAPIGDYIHCAKFIASKWVEVLKLLSRLQDVAVIDPQVAFTLLRVCGSFCRLAHIARSTPPSLSSDPLQIFDMAVKECFATCSALDLTEHAWQQAQLGLRYQYLKHAVGTFNGLVSTQDTILVGSTVDSPIPQKALSFKIDTEHFRALLDSSSPANKARLLSASASHASSWLSVVPSVELGLHLDPHEFCVGIKWWLGLDISRGLSCSLCPNTALDLLGHHAVTCKKGGDVVTRHNRLRDVFVDFCHQAHLGVHVEVGSNLTPDGSRSRPADVWVCDWISGSFAAFDFTVSSPLSVASLNQACITSGFAALSAETRKHKANDPKCSSKDALKRHLQGHFLKRDPDISEEKINQAGFMVCTTCKAVLVTARRNRCRHHQNSSIISLCKLWLKSEFQALWRHATNCSVSNKTKTSKQFDVLNSAIALAMEGSLGKAYQVLTSSGIAANNDSTFQQLLGKHHQGPVPVPPAIVATENNIIPQDFDLLSVLRSFPKASACGPSGLGIQHLLDAAEVHLPTPICPSLREVVCLLASGRAPVEVSKFLAGGSLSLALSHAHTPAQLTPGTALIPDALGHHALTCKSGGDLIVRHNALRYTFLESCKQACIGGQLEAGSSLDEEGRQTRPADILVQNWEFGKPAALDFTVTSPLNPTTLNGGTLQSLDQAKVAMIQQVDRKLLFIPIVFILLRIWGTLEFIFTEVYSKYFCTNSPAFLGVLSALRFLQAIGDGGQGWSNAILYIFNSPKIRNLLLKDLTTCCSRTASILNDCRNQMKVKTKDYEATTTSEFVRISVPDESHVDFGSSEH